MAIGSPDKATRLAQLRNYARVQVWSGFRPIDDVRADVFEAVQEETKDDTEATRLTEEFVSWAQSALAEAADTWPAVTEFDRLQAAFAELAEADIVVLQACDDHWAANDLLRSRAAGGTRPRGVVYFTHTDIWHAIDHGMLELNVWHGNSANVAEGDVLLKEVQVTLAIHGIHSLFDEGRIEATVAWQRRPAAG